MLEALGKVPDGVPACGWVTVMAYVPVINGYDRFQTPVACRACPGWGDPVAHVESCYQHAGIAGCARGP